MKTFANIKNSTDKKNILHILSDISNGIFHTQRKISIQLGISAGLANSYVKRCLKKGWIKFKTVPKKRYIYYYIDVIHICIIICVCYSYNVKKKESRLLYICFMINFNIFN